MRNEALNQVSVGVEDIDEPIARAFHVIVMLVVLQGKGDIEKAINVLDAEGSETLGWGAGDRAIARQLRVGESIDEIKFGIELLYLAKAKIGGIEEVAGAGLSEGQPFVDRTR